MKGMALKNTYITIKRMPKRSAHGGGGDEKPSSSNSSKLMGIFPTLYTVLAGIAVLLYVLLFVLSMLDYFGFKQNERNQETSINVDPKMLLTNTNDYAIVQYPMKQDDEPYRVYTTQKIISSITLVIAITFVILGLQLGIHFGFVVASYLSTLDYNEDIRDLLKSRDVVFPFIFITVVLVAVLSLNIGVYQGSDQSSNSFVSQCLKEFKETLISMQGIRLTYIRNVPIRDAEFWRHLKDNNTTEIAKKIANLLKSLKATDGPTHKNVLTIKRMLFACNIYSHFKDVVPENDPKYASFQMVFSTSANKREADINGFFMYNKIRNVPNIAYNELEDDIKRQYQIATQGVASPVPLSTMRTRFQLDRSSALEDFNEKINSLKNIEKNKELFGNYLSTFFWVAFFFLVVIIGGVLATNENIKYQVIGVLETIKSFFSALYSKVTGRS